VSVEVTIVPTGTANLASVVRGLERAGAAVRAADRPEQVAGAARLVLPGVGAFGPAMDALRRRGVDAALREAIEAGRPVLAVCVGMQLLGAASEESPGATGLGVTDATAGPFRPCPGVRVPQMGWNRVVPVAGCALLAEGHAYFANSYRIDRAPDGWLPAWAEHGQPFVAAVERDAQLACQFHPELSGAWGQALLRRWLARSGGNGAC
jgi:imidazole glycerol phosphate synthase glutamine amidotransferase subunit